MTQTTKLDWSKSAPADGWKPQTYYVVEVQWSVGNPAHRAILYTGFWNARCNEPGSLSVVFNASYDRGKAYPGDLYSVRVISEIEEMKDA